MTESEILASEVDNCSYRNESGVCINHRYANYQSKCTGNCKTPVFNNLIDKD